MKQKAILTALFVAGLAASFAVGSTAGILEGSTSTHAGTGTTTGEDHHKSDCQHVELKGSKGSGSVSFTVTRANHGAQDLVGKSVTLTLSADSSVSANACRDASGTLTLRNLKVANNNSGGGDH